MLAGCVAVVVVDPPRRCTDYRGCEGFHTPPPQVHHKPMPPQSNRPHAHPNRPSVHPQRPIVQEPVRPRNPEQNWRDNQPNNQPPGNRFPNR